MQLFKKDTRREPGPASDLFAEAGLVPAGEAVLDVAAELDEALAAHGRAGGKKRLVKIGSGAVALAVAAGLCLWLIPTAEGAQADGVAAYKETVVTRGDLTVGVTESGTVTVSTRNASTDFTAEVVEVYVRAGEQVRAGDALALIDLSDAESQIATLKSEYEAAKVSYDQASLQYQEVKLSAEYTLSGNEAKSTTAQEEYDNTIQKLQNAKDTAQYNYDNTVGKIESATEEIWRLEALIEQGYTYESDATAATAEEENEEGGTGGAGTARSATEQTLADRRSEALGQLNELQQSLAGLQLAIDEAALAYTTGKLAADEKYAASIQDYNNRGSIYSTEVSAASLSVEAAKTKMDDAYEAWQEAVEALGDGLVLAPCDGLVQQVNVAAGDTAMSGQAIAVVTDASEAYVTVSIAQDDIADITIGKAVNISFTAYEGTWVGEVDSIATTAARENASTVSYTVSIAVEGDTTGLYTGMTGDVTFITKQVQDALYVSNNAVYTENGESFVKLLAADGSLVETRVETGFSDGRNVEILAGLVEGDVAVVESAVGQ